MKVCRLRFNLYLALTLALLCGCRTAKEKDQHACALRIHIESQANALGTSQTISLLRADPVLVTIAKEPILTEANIIAARVIESEGGYALEIKFDESGTWCLEQFTAANPGKHLVIFGQWGATMVDGRWLGAPLITHRIGNGVLSFTPDASREEADQLVLGLNPTPKKHKKSSSTSSDSNDFFSR